MAAVANSAQGREPDVLTTISSIKQLTENQAFAQKPVHLRGVVTFNAADSGNTYCIQNSTGAIFVDSPTPLPGKPGDLVDIRGKTSFANGYAPVRS
jgi:hypothetical protein